MTSLGLGFPRYFFANWSRGSAYRGSCWCFVSKANTRAALKMTHILHMAEDTAGEKDYFLTLRYADPQLTFAEVREGSLQWTPSAKTLAIIGLPPIRKVVGEQRQCQTKGRTRVFGLTCFLIKSRGQTTPSNLDFGDSSVLSEMHLLPKHPQARIFPPTSFKNSAPLIAMIRLPCLEKENIFWAGKQSSRKRRSL